MLVMEALVVPATTLESKPEDSKILMVISPITLNSAEMFDGIADMF